MLQYLRHRSRLQASNGLPKSQALPNSFSAIMQKRFQPPMQNKTFGSVQQVQKQAAQKQIAHAQKTPETPPTALPNTPGLPQKGGLPKTPGLPDMKILPQKGGLPGADTKSAKKKRKYLKKFERKAKKGAVVDEQTVFNELSQEDQAQFEDTMNRIQEKLSEAKTDDELQQLISDDIEIDIMSLNTEKAQGLGRKLRDRLVSEVREKHHKGVANQASNISLSELEQSNLDGFKWSVGNKLGELDPNSDSLEDYEALYSELTEELNELPARVQREAKMHLKQQSRAWKKGQKALRRQREALKTQKAGGGKKQTKQAENKVETLDDFENWLAESVADTDLFNPEERKNLEARAKDKINELPDQDERKTARERLKVVVEARKELQGISDESEDEGEDEGDDSDVSEEGPTATIAELEEILNNKTNKELNEKIVNMNAGRKSTHKLYIKKGGSKAERVEKIMDHLKYLRWIDGTDDGLTAEEIQKFEKLHREVTAKPIKQGFAMLKNKYPDLKENTKAGYISLMDSLTSEGTEGEKVKAIRALARDINSIYDLQKHQQIGMFTNVEKEGNKTKTSIRIAKLRAAILTALIDVVDVGTKSKANVRSNVPATVPKPPKNPIRQLSDFAQPSLSRRSSVSEPAGKSLTGTTTPGGTTHL